MCVSDFSVKGILKSESFKEDMGSDRLLDNSASMHVGSNSSTDQLLGNTSNIQVSQPLYVWVSWQNFVDKKCLIDDCFWS